mmetsp:Transcript_312/g.823  ORF Transcript_312/g.823 Transcript_312/m.823 type:complete len:89 (+) Transcript_312:44-310(+)|eukprot:CAMPEP_0197416180 /NCGR_PEP_ID=MMETSP1170-20131217/2548_1 /TAXON_ID=54406 /ORGANISM="Sarcinochrysis sp, Strain CCMP770" /LENGTH=88 /DNA_ID=CAMNT_0042943059 /DNA_START=44 /DNA_END=310 /DNA_ORIENTATION=-
MIGRVALGTTTATRAGARTIFNIPNRIHEYRKPFVANPHLVGADNPTWLKLGKSDQYVFLFGVALSTTALIGVFSGIYMMATGKGKLK